MSLSIPFHLLPPRFRVSRPAPLNMGPEHRIMPSEVEEVEFAEGEVYYILWNKNPGEACPRGLSGGGCPDPRGVVQGVVRAVSSCQHVLMS